MKSLSMASHFELDLSRRQDATFEWAAASVGVFRAVDPTQYRSSGVRKPWRDVASFDCSMELQATLQRDTGKQV